MNTCNFTHMWHELLGSRSPFNTAGKIALFPILLIIFIAGALMAMMFFKPFPGAEEEQEESTVPTVGDHLTTLNAIRDRARLNREEKVQ